MINVLKALRGVINIVPWILLVGVVYVLINFFKKMAMNLTRLEAKRMKRKTKKIS